jgi:hypothetical protein
MTLATTDNQTVAAAFISFLRKQNFTEEHSEGIESKIKKFNFYLNSYYFLF